MRRAAWWLCSALLFGCDHCGCGEEVESLVAVANCGLADGDVRRRPATSSAWGTLAVGDALFPGDWVQTALSAAARVDFHTGTKLQVAPGSTVVIEDPGVARRQRVSVKSGRVEGDLLADAELSFTGPDGQPATLKAQGATRYRLEVESGGAIAVAVTEGRAALTQSDGTQADVAAGEARTLRPGQPISPAQRLLAAPAVRPPPAPPRSGEPVSLEVAEVSGAARYRFEVSRDPNFEKLAQTKESESPRLDFAPDEPGTWYVRATALSPEGKSGTTSSPLVLQVLPPPPPNDLLAPAEGTVVAVDGAEAQVELSWRPSPADSWVAVVGKEPSLQAVVVEQSTTQSKVVVRLPIGRYVWGVYRVRGGQREPIFPAPRSLAVVAANRELKVPKAIPWR